MLGGEYMELRTRIRKRRLELKMSQAELAKKLGYISRSSIAKIEAGVNDLTQSKIMEFADALMTTPEYLMGFDEAKFGVTECKISKGVKIPVLGRVAAGMPIEAVEDIEDYEEIPEAMAARGDFFALRIQGKSMEPKFSDGDVVIVRKQDDIDSGEIGVVIVNGSDATVKKVMKQENGIMLVATNQVVYPPKYYDRKAIEELPVRIIGRVVELRAKF
jgi:repressor LexA